MASGNSLDTFFPPGDGLASAFATFDVRNGHPLLKFDAGTDQSAVWTRFLARHYGGGGLTLTICWSGATATSGNVVWNAQIERIDDEGLDIDADSFASAQAVTAAAPATTGMMQYSAITFTSGAQMDSLAAGELFRLKLTRDADNGSDTMTGFAELHGAELRET
jgi:hypothetical protein